MKNLDTQILVDALSKQATRIARDCLPEGKLSGHYFFAGSIAGEAGKSLVVLIDVGRWTDYNSIEHYGDMLGLIYWTLAKQNWAEAFKIAKEYVGDIDYRSHRNIVETANDEKTQRYNKHQKFAYKIWNEADLTIGEAGQKYLKSRKLFISEYYSKYIVRYVAELKHMDGNEYPALIFRITDVENKFLGIQRIYLTADGKKIDEDAKLTLGNVIGGSLKMGRYKPKTILLSEGIEDGLSLNPLAIKNKDLGIWSGLGANHLMTIDIPDYVERIIICSDNDEITKAVIDKLEARYGKTKKVITHLPPKKYKDYNQFLVETNGYQIENHFTKILKYHSKF